MFTLLASFALIDFYRNPKSGLFFSKRTKCNYLLHYFAYSLLRHLIVKKIDFSISSTHILQLFSNHNSIVVQLYILMSYVFTVHAVRL